MRAAGALTAACVAFVWLAPAAPTPGPVTFARDVAPILFSQCATCHHPGGPAPFTLMSYDDARRHAAQIAAVTRSRLMPPWKPEPEPIRFLDERRLTDDQIRTLDQWTRDGAPEGAPSDLPPAPRWSGGWPLGEPDLILDLPEYQVPAGGADVFRNFVVSVPGAVARYVRGLQFQPRNRAVHHANIRVDPTRASREFAAADLSRRSAAGAEADPAPGYSGAILRSADYPDGHFLGWTPGQVAPLAPAGLGWQINPGSDLVIQLHLQPTGKVERIRPSVGLYFTADAPARRPTMVRLGRQSLDIPAGAAAYRVTDAYVLPVGVEVHAIQPHAHYRARSVRAAAVRPDGTRTTLIRIERWDFNWQDQYRLAAPLPLPAGTRIEMEYIFDNSDANPRNPQHPPRRVAWGWRSSDEMADVWIQVMTRSDGDRRRLDADVRRKMALEDTIGCETLIARDPAYAALRDDAAALYMELGQPAKALTHFRVVEQLQPGSARARFNAGVALEAMGRTDDASREYKEAIALDPAYSVAQNNLGSLLFASRRVDEARVHFERAVAGDPANAEAQNNLGAASLALGHGPPARAALERAIALRPDYPEAHFNLARLAALDDRREDAVREAAVAETQAAAAGKVALLSQVRELLGELRRRQDRR